MTGNLKVLVCGGRDFADVEQLNRVLDFNRDKIRYIIEGGAQGADTLACRWARRNNVTCFTFKADWGKHGRRAGYVRNLQMLQQAHPDLVVAFKGGVGTRMMVDLARRAGVRVIEIPARGEKPKPRIRVLAGSSRVVVDDGGQRIAEMENPHG